MRERESRSGRNRRRVLHGGVDVITGETMRMVRKRNRGVAAQTIAGKRLLVFDNALPHHTHVARGTVEAMGNKILPLQFRAPEPSHMKMSGGR